MLYNKECFQGMRTMYITLIQYNRHIVYQAMTKGNCTLESFLDTCEYIDAIEKLLYIQSNKT